MILLRILAPNLVNTMRMVPPEYDGVDGRGMAGDH